MCGIAGFAGPDLDPLSSPALITSMLDLITHRGPDEAGYYFDNHVAIGAVRLSIIDIAYGHQPMPDPTNRYWIVYNGETYNFKALRNDLEKDGVNFRTHCDTEVVLQAWMRRGTDCLHALNGGYAFVIYDRQERELVLARDRFGKRPLFVKHSGAGIAFASEMKAFLGCPDISFKWDKERLRTLFTLWTSFPNESCFSGIDQVEPGVCIRFRDGSLTKTRFTSYKFRHPSFKGDETEAADNTRRLIDDSVRLRLQSDVPVGTYLSGGIDSAVITALAQKHSSTRVSTFSVSFADSEFDESEDQRLMSSVLGTEHRTIRIENGDIAENFPAAVWHAEFPVFRTALVPMYLLSGITADAGIKVVLTGEGSDEIFLGYDVFKETMLRLNWKSLSTTNKADLLSRLYKYLPHFRGQNAKVLLGVFDQLSSAGSDELFSHDMRIHNSHLAVRLLRDGQQDRASLVERLLALEPGFRGFSPLGKAQTLEMLTLLTGYLLSSQGDRMALGHSVENRCPFLDLDVVEWAGNLPDDVLLRGGFDDKWILRRAFKDVVPDRIVQKPKFPYRSPDGLAFLGKERPDYVAEMLSSAALDDVGVLDTEFSRRLVAKLLTDEPGRLSPRENQAFILLLSTSLLHQYFVKRKLPAAQAPKLNFVSCYDGRASRPILLAGGVRADSILTSGK